MFNHTIELVMMVEAIFLFVASFKIDTMSPVVSDTKL